VSIFTRREKIALFLVVFFLVADFFAWQEVFRLTGRMLKVVFFDVGQGDCIFIETPQGHQIMIDGGPDAAVVKKLKKEVPFWDRGIDLVILTHPEKDHLAGLLEVLKRYRIDHILWTGVARKTDDYNEWKELIKTEGAKTAVVKGGESIKAGDVEINILYPLESLEGKEFENSNDTSIVSRLIFYDSTFLFTGDITSKVELKLVDKDVSLKSEVLKVAHHGSKYSSADGFLNTVSPDIAVIQVGNNPYGHPAQEVLQRLDKFGVETFRTDIDGDIKLISDGSNLLIKN